MGYASNGMTSIRNNRNLQKYTAGQGFKDRGRSTFPPVSNRKRDKKNSYAALREKMELREVHIFLVFGVICVAIGLLTTLWLL